jgi:hypothetical protein
MPVRDSARRARSARPTPISHMPYLDEHATAIAVDADDVWPVLLDTLDRAFSRDGLATSSPRKNPA